MAKNNEIVTLIDQRIQMLEKQTDQLQDKDTMYDGHIRICKENEIIVKELKSLREKIGEKQ